MLTKAQQDYQTAFNNMGIVNPVPFDLNPPSNIGIVYQNANDPNTPGSFAPGQAISDLTFVSGYSQRRIRITMNPGENPKQSAGSIAIINKDNAIIVSFGDVENTAFSIGLIQPQTDTTALFIRAASGLVYNSIMMELSIEDSGSAGDNLVIHNAGSGQGVFVETNGGLPLNLLQDAVVSTNFKSYIGLGIGGTLNTVFQSDGTDPNGVLTGNQGDVCLNASGTGIIKYCSGGTVWVAV